MGMDKGTIAYHGKPERERLYDMLGQYCARTFLSIRADQETEMTDGHNLITDRDLFRGPLNGILSAHHFYPDKAWLVLACDLPLIDHETIETLVGGRQKDMDATALATFESKLPEPLAAIWEPGGLKKAREYLVNANSSCPRKFLLNMANTHLIYPGNDQVLYNANSLSEYEEARAKLGIYGE